MKSVAIIACLAASPAFADIKVQFIESAPKDTFEFTNVSGCDLGPTKITVDMSQSAAGLYFDTTSQGAGIDVFQPFELVSGTAAAIKVVDGDTSLTLALEGLAAGETAAFTIDVDDSLRHGERGQIQVSRSEIAGTSVIVTQSDTRKIAVIDNTARATVRLGSCIS